MKTSLACFAFILSLIIMSEMPAQVTSSPSVRDWNADGDFGKLRAGVELRYQSIESDGGKRGCYLFREKGGGWQTLSAPIENVNRFLMASVESTDEKMFVSEQLSKLLLAIMADANAYIINDEFLAMYRRSGPAASAAKLESLLSKSEASFSNDDWILVANVGSAKGGVERWEVTGKLAPLRISVITRVSIHPSGWYSPLVTSGNQ